MMGTGAVSNPKALGGSGNGDCIYETVCGGVVSWVERRVNVPIPSGSHASGSLVKNFQRSGLCKACTNSVIVFSVKLKKL